MDQSSHEQVEIQSDVRNDQAEIQEDVRDEQVESHEGSSPKFLLSSDQAGVQLEEVLSSTSPSNSLDSEVSRITGKFFMMQPCASDGYNLAIQLSSYFLY